MSFYSEVNTILESIDMTGGRHEGYDPIDPDFDLLPKEIEYIDRFSQLYIDEFRRDWNYLNAAWIPKLVKRSKSGVIDVSIEGEFSTTNISVFDRIMHRITDVFHKEEQKNTKNIINGKSAESTFQKMMIFAREKTFRNIQITYNFEYDEYMFAFGGIGINGRGQGYSFKNFSMPYSFGWFEVDKFQKRVRSLFAAWLYTLLYHQHNYNLVWDSNVLIDYKKDREVHTLVSKDTDDTFGSFMDEL